MKKLLLILIIFQSCQKIQQRKLEIVDESGLIIENISDAKGGVKGKPKPTPQPIPDPVPPPPTGSGYSCIFVDSDGHAATGWGEVIECASAGNIDMAQIMSEVRALYANYNVVITDDEAVYNNANPYKRIRVVVTTTSAWKDPAFSGVAYVGSFTWGDNTPCFVFSDRLYFLPHMIAEIVAHEAGHTLGLYHQTEYDANCNLVSRYKNGAVMGNSLNSVQGQWIYGTTYACDAYQDDAAVIRSVL